MSMEKFSSPFPFVAIVGQDKVKKAILLSYICPQIGGILLSGEKGTAKSTLVRGLSQLLDINFVELPLNASEDMLVGSVDIERAIRYGENNIEYGLLKKAHMGILYIDEVNLLSEHIVNILLNVSASGVNVIEREGISHHHKSDFILVGSMNPEEGQLRTHFLDRFGLYVSLRGEMDIDLRCEIIRRRLEYEKNPKQFCDKYKEETERLRSKLLLAKTLLNKVHIPKDIIRFASDISTESSCQGHRAEIILCYTAVAIAVLDGRVEVSEDDVKEATFFVLPHRIKESFDISEVQVDKKCESQNNDTLDNEDLFERQDLIDEESNIDNANKDSIDNSNVRENSERIEPHFEEYDISLDKVSNKKIEGEGKRLKVKTNSKRGRYIRYRTPKGKATDIAVDATLRSASMHKNSSEHLLVTINKDDIRQKVRESRSGATILFLVDASGSMGAKRRMSAVKGAVFSILSDAYEKRDKVAIVSFRNDSAKVLLNFTRSIDLAQKSLKVLATGGKTPLAYGLVKAKELLRVDRIKNKDALQYLVIVSDGKANISIRSENCLDEVLQIASTFTYPNLNILVLDTESGQMNFGFSKKLATSCNAKYVQLNKTSKQEIEAHVKNFVRR